ncbi:hypothetical protein PCASD_19961 [Puccinia coronata f. sp. avenae]|uniref:Tet-like 2OG-Fe(II) oxygenase domain-containing protein n=1 Tax=Puccinia coronata f. sp. avenae TaxID=200324 RepID=A0A2N5SIG5_9BASI|nr:hypothetical protein PCASD_19961 [Puccinia coronata f. sp. avenae]
MLTLSECLNLIREARAIFSVSRDGRMSIKTLTEIHEANRKRKWNEGKKLKVHAEDAKAFTSMFTSDVASMYCRYKPLDVYPVRIAKDKTPEAIRATHPTAEEFKAGEEMILDEKKFKLISHGRLVLYEIDPTDKKKKNFIAYIHFTRSDQLSELEKYEYNFVTEFLHKSKDFVRNVLSKKIFRGKMWTIGWRKSQESGELIGRYVDADGIVKYATRFLDNIIDGITSSDIIHNMFFSIADLAVESANKLLKSLNMPAFQDPNLKPSPSENNFASNLAFTQNEFSNRPHHDKDDSKTAFLLLCNTNRHTGTLSLGYLMQPDFDISPITINLLTPI